MKLMSWNVNGIRAIGQKGFFEWLKSESPDVLCLQETKAHPDQLDLFFISPQGYRSYWFSAQKPGYSGVALYSKSEPKSITEGIGNKLFDDEGRVITAEFDKFFLINAYFPNSQRDHSRLQFKLDFCKEIYIYCETLRKKNKHIVLCGDYNIAHREIDLRNPKSNKDNAGFLPEERAWMDHFTNSGYADVFRKLNPNKIDAYTWWSYRPGVRERNIGWRLDYFCVDEALMNCVKSAEIYPQVFGSDHCPVSLEIDIP
jgi:exodeoxyribonuclease-3